MGYETEFGERLYEAKGMVHTTEWRMFFTLWTYANGLWFEDIPALKERPASRVRHYELPTNQMITHAFLAGVQEHGLQLIDNYVLYDAGRYGSMRNIADDATQEAHFDPEKSSSNRHVFIKEKIAPIHKLENGVYSYLDEATKEWTVFTIPINYPTNKKNVDPAKYPYQYRLDSTAYNGRLSSKITYRMNRKLHVVPSATPFQMSVKTYSYIIGKTAFKAAVLSWTYYGDNLRSTNDLNAGDEIVIQIKKVGEADSEYKQIGAYVSSQALILGLDPTTEYNMKGIYTTNGHKIRDEVGYVSEVDTTNTLSEDSTQSRKKRATLSSWDPNATVVPPILVTANVVGKMAKVSWGGSASPNISHYIVKCAFYKDVTSTADGVTQTDAVLVHRDEVEVSGESPSYLILFTETGDNMRCLVKITAVNYALVESQPTADITVFPE